MEEGRHRRRHYFHHDPSILDSEWRRSIQPVEPVIDLITREIPVRRVAIDFGAGTGYYTIPLSRLFERVYAVDVNPRMLELLGEKLRAAGISNVELIGGDRIPDIEADLLLLANVLHELPDPDPFIGEAAGRARNILVIDWRRIETPWGPPLHERIPEEEAVKMLSRHYRVRVYDIYKYHYVLLGSR